MKKFIFVLSLCVAGFMQAQTVLVDSTITYDIDGNYASKLEYQYDSLGRQIAAIGYEWVEGVKVGKDYTQTDYDAQGRKVQETVYRWITATSEYVSDTRTNYTYDGTSNTIVAIVHQAYVADKGRWRYVDMYQYAYENGRQVLEEHSVMGEEDWVSQYKHTWEYNVAGKILLDQVDSLLNDNNIIFSRHTYEYDGNKTILDQTEKWQEITSKLEIDKQTKNVYNANGKLILTTELAWDKTTLTTDSSKKTIYEYDAANRQTLKEYYSKYINKAWVGNNKTLNNYDENGNVVFYEYYTWSDGWKGNAKYDQEWNANKKVISKINWKWNTSTKDWERNTKVITNYDGNTSNKTEEATYTWNGSDWGKAGDTRKTTVYTNGNPTEVINYTWNAGWENKSKTATTYNGDITITENFTWVDNAWKGTSYKEVEKLGGNTVRELVKKWEEGNWVNYTLHTCVYTGSYKTTDHTYVWNGEEWVDNMWTEDTYEGNVKVLSLTKRWDTESAKWVMVSGSRSETEKDGNGNIIRKETFTCGSDSVWVGASKTVYTYDDANRLLTEQAYVSQSGNYINSYIITKEYDANGNLILDKRMNWQGGEEGIWVGSGTGKFYEYAYNDQNKQIMNATYMWNKTLLDWDGLNKNGYEYDETGLNKLYDVKYSWDYSKRVWYINNKMTEIRDEQGRIIEKSQFPYDTVTSQYLNGTREEYAYRGDEQVKDNIYKWYNDQWNRSQVAEKHYDSEAADALLRITVDGAWTDEGVLISYDSVYYFYNTDPKLRTIVFKNWNDTVLEQQQLLDGELPEYKGETPTKTADAQYTYTFTGWDRAIESVTKDTFYTAQFSSTLNKYNVYFVNGEDTLQREQLEYGVMPEYKGETPTKAADAQYTYTFKGWKPEIVAVAAEATYEAEFDSTAVLYNVYFVNGEDTLQREQLEYGVMPEYKGETPTKADTETQYFTFLGWTPDIAEVTEEATYSAEFEAHNKVPTNMEQTEQKIELDLTQPMYNVQGQRVDETYHGIVIQNCRTFLR